MKAALSALIILGLSTSAFAGADTPVQDKPSQDQPKQDQPKQDKPSQDQPKQDKPDQDQPSQDEQPKHKHHRDEAAEIQIFMNYKGGSRYDEKMVSTVETPLSAEPLYWDWHEAQPTNGACFKGKPEAALELFETMVSILNREQGMSLTVTGTCSYDEEIQDHALNIWAYDHSTNQEWNWFPRLRHCVR